MLEVHARVELEGPLFDGRALAALDDYTEAVADDVAAQGFKDIHFTLHRVLRRPTGYYQSRIRNRPLSSTTRVLYDDRVIYGHWLEGTGSRNSPVTRFPGYFTFRRVTQHLNKKAVGIAEATFGRFEGRFE